MHDLLRVKKGKRVFCTGRTGSGKTQGEIFLIEDRQEAVIILDTKIEEKFPLLPRAHIFNGLESVKFEKVREQFQKGELQYFIVRPLPEEMDHDTLDDFLYSLYEGCRNVTICIDEIYSVTGTGDPGPGLTALYTRGRSRGLTVIGCAQRPSWVPIFCMSESDYFMVYSLTMLEDKKRLASMGLGEPVYKSLDPYHFLWYIVSDNDLTEFGPVPVRSATPDNRANTGDQEAALKHRFL